MSKGHASAVYYSTLKEFGELSKKKLYTFVNNGSYLSGHVSKFANKLIPFSSGSLGNGIGVARGVLDRLGDLPALLDRAGDHRILRRPDRIRDARVFE